MLPELCEILHNSLIDFTGISLEYENTKTKIDNEIYGASFYFKDNNLEILAKSEKSEKATTINDKGNILTTINCLETDTDIYRFLKEVKLIEHKQEAPVWFKDINIYS